MQEFLDRDKRQEASYTDSLHIYRARVVTKMEPGDDRLRVRIIPHMIDIDKKEALPKYPAFFKGQVITSKTEDVDKKEAEYVWVAALPDFTVGFVLGLANSYETTSSKFSQSYNYKDMLQGLIQRGVANSDMKYEDLLVQFWNPDYMEFINIRSGEKFWIQGNGTMIAMTKNQIYMRVGAESIDNSKFSAIRMSREEISFVTKRFKIKAADISLGQKGLFVTGMASPIPIAAQGATFHPRNDPELQLNLPKIPLLQTLTY